MQVLFILALVGFLVVFGLQNSEHVLVSFVIGSPTKVRLIFLLLMSAAIGFLLSYIRGIGREIKLKRKLRALASLKSTALAQLPATHQDTTDDD